MSMRDLMQNQRLHGLNILAEVPASYSNFFAISTAGRRLMHQAEIVAPHLELAVIEGEAGVGKQALAQLLHVRSTFARSKFNHCDAREWLMAAADAHELTGFIYLDRVDLLGAPGQALLLRFLTSAGDRAARNFAVVASSEISLRKMAGEGRFLPDLAFRLTAVRFAIPPLRERREDIAPLANSFLERISARYRFAPLTLAPGAIVRLLGHDWPGNAGELFSVLESAMLDCSDGVIHAEDLSIVSASLPERCPTLPRSRVLALDTIILEHIRKVLDLNHGNKLKSARQLGISRSTLYRLLANVKTFESFSAASESDSGRTGELKSTHG
jgi:DNA-binding NtrC family response regulator